MSTWLAALVAVAAIGATYYFCIRPMRRGGHCGMGAGECQSDTERDREIAELREELRILRAEDAIEFGPVSDPAKRPPTAST